ncbi:NAD-dependent epimerase/dehydratase family protein [Pacificoceanicola onchidii]|uniref:NAD-dependent epimerase/dehydratase family protein n=1 Tax=Pacificoceanicola onchidii TaxID=2562685 RepID=UPI0010A47251|nr:NAD(P)-dependent oxidoreductase [Pacificoceanicola onchidii]
MRIAFTGGSGKAGRHILPMLAAEGHTVLNLDLTPLEAEGVDNLICDLTDPGQVFSALSGYANFAELAPGTGVPKFDAVVHFAALARILIAPDCETFRVNTLSTYNVMEAAVKLGIPKVIFASSETAYGICFADGVRKPQYIPVDEDHPTEPEDAYAMSKVVGEATGRAFQARAGIDVYGLRINNVIAPEEYETLFPAFVADAALRERNIFGYIDVRDLGQMVMRCLAVDGLGYEVFNVANDDLSVGASNAQVREQFYEGIPVKREMTGNETMYCNRKARDVLGFAPEHSWRDVIKM